MQLIHGQGLRRQSLMYTINQITNETIKWSMEKALSIYQSKSARNRSLIQIFRDCASGKTLEEHCAEDFKLKFNPKTETFSDVDSYDHDLYNPMTLEKYEVKQSKLSTTYKFGRTLVFHENIMNIAKDSKRNFDYFIFGESKNLTLDTVQGQVYTAVYAKISRADLIEFSSPSRDKGYFYFKDAIARSQGSTCECYYKG